MIYKIILLTSLKLQKLDKASFVLESLPFLLALVCFSFFPRYYSSHDYTFRIAESILAGDLGLVEEPSSWLNEFVPHDGRFYSVFPLGAVLCMLPFVFLKALGLLSGMPSALIVSLLVYFSSYFSIALTSKYDLSNPKRIILVIALFLGTFLLPNLAQGGAWQVALAFSFFAQLGAFYFTFIKFKPLVAGAFFALAFGNRTELVLLAPVFLYLLSLESGQKKYSTKHLLFRFCLVPFFLGISTLIYNYLRFDSALDFGYARIPGVLEEPWYRDGLFAVSAISRNATEMLFRGFRINETFPYIVPTGFGGSIFLYSPFLFLIFRLKKSANQIVLASWFAILIATSVLFLHGNPGGWQYSYRYAIELLPWFFLIILETSRRELKPFTFTLCAVSIMLNLYGTWLFNWTAYVKP